jgi:cation transport ATPase
VVDGMIGYIAALVCTVTTLGCALLQLSLTLGAPLGEYALGGQDRVLPKRKRLLSGTLSVLWVIFGMLNLQKGKILDIGLNSTFVNTMLIIYTVFLGYAIIGNGFITKSKKEKYVMTPLSAVTFIMSVITLLF